MAGPPKSSGPLTFGPFQLNRETGDLKKGDSRLRLSSQLFRILVLLLERRNEVVTREELRNAIWTNGTFVDYEHSLNTAVNRLRSLLCDSAENPRYIETVPGRGYRFIGTIEYPSPRPGGGAGEMAKPRRNGLLVAVASVCAVLLIVPAVAVYKRHTGVVAEFSEASEVIRLTANSGLTTFPSISRDGKLVAYASDRNAEGRSDLYVQNVAGGSVVRITSDGEGNTMPDFSPDGSKVIFASHHNDGGIFEIPAFGGPARPIAANGRNPKYSPAGSMIAFWRGTASVAASVPGSGTAWVIPSSGGQPRRIGGTLAVARSPMWLPDSKHLVVIGYDSTRAFETAHIDWWVVSTSDDEVVRLPLRRTLVEAGLSTNGTSRTPAPSVPSPACWLPGDSSIVFSTGTGDTINLWSGGFSMAEMALTGKLIRKTRGAGNERYASCSAGGDIAFANQDDLRQVWSIPNLSASPEDGMKALTTGQVSHENPAISLNEHSLAFTVSGGSSRPASIWMQVLGAATESEVTPSRDDQRYPAIDHAGNRVAYSVYEAAGRSIYVSGPGTAAQRVCEHCVRATDWSWDDKSLLIFAGTPYRLESLQLASGERRVLLSNPNQHLLYGRFSPDNKWVSFTKRLDESQGEIFLARVSGQSAAGERDWISIATAGGDDWANWSVDGQTIYYSTNRDGHTCFWAQRLHPITKHPIGDAVAVRHLHGRLSFDHAGWAIGRSRMFVSLLERTGSVWLIRGHSR